MPQETSYETDTTEHEIGWYIIKWPIVLDLKLSQPNMGLADNTNGSWDLIWNHYNLTWD